MTATAKSGPQDHQSGWPPPPPSVEGDTEEDGAFRAEAEKVLGLNGDR